MSSTRVLKIITKYAAKPTSPPENSFCNGLFSITSSTSWARIGNKYYLRTKKYLRRDKFFKKLTNNSYRSWIRHYTKPCDRNQKTGLDEYFCPLHPFAAAGLITLKASNFRLSTEYLILTKSKNWNQMRSIEKTNNMMSFLYDIPTQSSVC